MELITQVKNIIQKQISDWQNEHHDQIQLLNLGGTTNFVFKVMHSQKKHKPIIIKQLSQVQGLFNRQQQNLIFIQANKIKVAPCVLYASNDFIIQQFIQNSSHPSLAELKQMKLRQSIIRVLSRFHTIQIKQLPKICFTDTFLNDEFIRSVYKKIQQTEYTQQETKIINEISQYINPNIIQLINHHLIPKNKSNIKICHNDLNNLNILITQKNVLLIDYQYAAYNYISYDIANLLNQMAFDYSESQFPYFKYKNQLAVTNQQLKQLAKYYLNEQKMQAVQIEKIVDNMVIQIRKSFGICNYYWALWSILMFNRQKKFGYIYHGKKRMQLFKKVLNEFISQKNV